MREDKKERHEHTCEYKRLLNSWHDAVSILDPQSHTAYCISPSINGKLGYSAGELERVNNLDLVHPEDIPNIKQAVRQCIESGETRVRYRFKKRDNSYVWTESTGITVNGGKESSLLLILSRDIHEQVLMEESLRKSEEQYRLVAENAYDLISILDGPSMTYKYVSPSHERLLGYKVEALNGQHCFNHIHPQDVGLVAAALEEGISAGYGSACYRILKKDRTYIWLETIGKLLNPEDRDGDILLVARDVTERILAEKAFAESHRLYRLIVDNAYDGISIVDSKTLHPLYQNPALKKMIGETENDLLQSNIFDMIHHEDQDFVHKAVAEGMQQGYGSVECRLLRKDGSYLWVEITGKVIDNRDGDPQLLFINRDITRRKMAEDLLRKSEEKYRRIADNTNDFIILVDPETMLITYASPSNSRMLGYSEEDCIGLHLLKHIHPDHREKILQAVSRLFIDKCVTEQYLLRKKDGSYIWAESNARMYMNDGQKWEILATTRDVTERKMQEEALLASEARLRVKEQELQERLNKLNYLIDNMNEIFLTFNRDRYVTFINKSGYQLLGYSSDEVTGFPLKKHVSKTHRGHGLSQLRRLFDHGEAIVFEIPVKTKQGYELLTRVKASPIIDEGQITGAMALVEDISEYRKIEKEMARLDQLNTIGEMAAGIGHEIRNPMTAVKGFLQILAYNGDFHQYQSYFNIMLDELDRANSIITEFLSLARNKLVNLQLCNLNHIIKALYPLLQADAMLGDKVVELDLSEIPDLLIDEKEIRQMLINLARNGLEAMTSGGRLSIHTCEEEGEVILRVKDQGPGIDEGLLDQLGKPFITTKENGTGLGLAICYSIAARHEARIEPVSTKHGTSMVVRFQIPATTTTQMKLL